MGTTLGLGRHRVSASTLEKSEIDLIVASKNLIKFLKGVYAFPCLFGNKRVLAEAIRRYEQNWIPLLLENPEERGLVPPIDVEWVWYCHMLNPTAYNDDMSRIAGRDEVPDHVMQALDSSEWMEGRKRAQRLWAKKFSEPFSLELQLAQAPQVDESRAVSQRSSYDFVSAAARQIDFYYQVAVLPHYQDQYFLELAVERYLDKFLELARRHPEGTWVPSTDIECVWRAHLLHPLAYAEETTELCGQLLPHDDSIPEPQLSARRDATEGVWKEEFGEELYRSGGMSRGRLTLAEWRCKDQLRSTLRSTADMSGLFLRQVCTDKRASMRVEHASLYRNRPKLPWVYQKDMSTKADGCRRFSCLGNCPLWSGIIQGQVVHGRSGSKSFSYMEVMKDPQQSMPVVTAHTMSSDELPSSEQVDNARECLTLDPSKEMAYLLRVAAEDVAVIVGEWVDFIEKDKWTPGTSAGHGTRMRRQHKRPGHLDVKIYSLQGRLTQCQVSERFFGDTRPRAYSFSLAAFMLDECMDTVDIDLCNSAISGFSNPTSAAVSFGFALAIGALHASLQPIVDGGYPNWTVQQFSCDSLKLAGGEIPASWAINICAPLNPRPAIDAYQTSGELMMPQQWPTLEEDDLMCKGAGVIHRFAGSDDDTSDSESNSESDSEG